MLGSRRDHLQLVHQAPVECLVDAVQLHHQRGSRLWPHHLDDRGVFRVVPHRGLGAGLVREQGGALDGGHAGHSGPGYGAAGTDVWAENLDLRGKDSRDRVFGGKEGFDTDAVYYGYNGGPMYMESFTFFFTFLVLLRTLECLCSIYR